MLRFHFNFTYKLNFEFISRKYNLQYTPMFNPMWSGFFGYCSGRQNRIYLYGPGECSGVFFLIEI